MINIIFCSLLFFGLCGGLLFGFPVAFTLAGVSIIFALIGNLFGIIDFSIFGAMPSRIFGNAISNSVLISVPLFIFMGVMMERSKVSEDLLDSMGKLFGPLPGGLGISVTIVGTLLAASTGIVGATVVTMGLLSLPTMLKRNYDPAYSTGIICASGTLGQIIPPSIVLIILGDQISNSYVLAQREMGNFAPEPVSVGDLFAGALFPGMVLVGLYLSYQIFLAIFYPKRTPSVHILNSFSKAFIFKIINSLIPPVALITAVLGSILGGLATPTEAASVGALGAIMLAGNRLNKLGESYKEVNAKHLQVIIYKLDRIFGFRGVDIYFALGAIILMLFLTNTFDLRFQKEIISTKDIIAIGLAVCLFFVVVWGILVSLWRVLRTGIMNKVVQVTTELSTMVFTILIGAAMFSLVFRAFGGDELVKEFLLNLPGGDFSKLLIVMIFIFLLGFILDFIEICFIVIPIVAPILLMSGISPVWLGVMIALNLQTSFLTPPFGFALFYLRSVMPSSISTTTLYRGILPFILLQLIALGLLAYFPQLADWLPNKIYGSDYSIK